MARPRLDSIDIATPQRLLDAAAAEFATHGFERATLADIASRAGIRRSSLLYHFESKEQLYGAVVTRTFELLGAVLEPPMLSTVPFEQQLEAMLRGYFEFATSRSLDTRLIVREMLEEQGPGVEIVRARIAPLLDRVVCFVERAGEGQLRSGLPVRAAVQQVVMDILMQAAMTDPLRELLWGPRSADRAWWLCRTLFLGEAR
jgi:AcrR family transcriptional regulator